MFQILVLCSEFKMYIHFPTRFVLYGFGSYVYLGVELVYLLLESFPPLVGREVGEVILLGRKVVLRALDKI